MPETERAPSKEGRLKDKSAIITGGASGIGRAIAELFAQEGASVLVADIDDQNGQETIKKIVENGGKAIFCHCDVTNPDEVRNMVRTAVENFGTANILINNAAAFIFGTAESSTEEDWDKVLNVNVKGYWRCAKEVIPVMRSAGGGAIVNIASVSAFIAQPEFVPYNTSKAAILNLTRTLAYDHGKDNIRVNSICPGTIRTRATDHHIESLGLDKEKALEEFAQASPLNRIGMPIDIAYGVLYLVSDESPFTTGASLVIDGGATID